MTAAAATIEGTLGLGVRCRLVTHSRGAPHWVTLGPDASTVILTPDATHAAWADYVLPVNSRHAFGYKLQLTMPSKPDAPYLVRAGTDDTLEVIPDTTDPNDMTLTPSELLWERAYGPDNEDPWYTLHSCTHYSPAITTPPYAAPDTPLRLGLPCLVFATEYLCDCGNCWTTDRTGICTFCRTQAHNALYTAIHGHPPLSPCDGCGEPTPYGGYCSGACKADATGVC